MASPTILFATAGDAASTDQTAIWLKRLHADLVQEWGQAEGRRDPAGVQRAATVDLASALLQHFGLSRNLAGPISPLASQAAAQLDGHLLDPVIAAEVLASVFGASVGSEGRRDRGAVYTPRHVVDWMVLNALEVRVAAALGISRSTAQSLLQGRHKPSDGECRNLARFFDGFRVLDPAAGAGAFVVGCCHAIARVATTLTSRGVSGLTPYTSPRFVLEKCCYGFEIDPQTATVATAVALLATHGVGYPQVLERPLIDVCNPLIEGFAHSDAPTGWDMIVMNPPYVGEKHLRARLGDGLARVLKERHGFAGDLLVHFVLRGLDALRPGGVMSAIVSDTAFTMDTATALRRRILDEHRLQSLAWCRPFDGVAVRAGIVTVAKEPPDGRGLVDWVSVDNGGGLADSPRREVESRIFGALPSRPFFRPTHLAKTFTERWASVPRLDELWRDVGGRRAQSQLQTHVSTLKPGDWTLLGAVVRSGQGLATGDDRRYVGYLADTPEGEAAESRRKRIVGAMVSDGDYTESAAEFTVLVEGGLSEQEALLKLITREPPLPVPGRKPFRTIQRHEVRSSSLTLQEQRSGITGGPYWIPYETSDRGNHRGGARWLRTNATVIDWSVGAVALLHARLAGTDRRPVLRNQALWFLGGVTHNRVTSYLRARKLEEGAIFSSESPVYVPLVDWLDEYALLALLNSTLIDYAIKTFLASRNHIEVGHVRRLPIPVLDRDGQLTLSNIGREACAAVRDQDAIRLRDLESRLDGVVGEMYGLEPTARLEVAR